MARRALAFGLVLTPLAAIAEPCPSATGPVRILPPAEARPIAMAAAPASPADYRDRLTATPLGWPRLDHWCVWIEPAAVAGPAARWDQIWWRAVQAALDSWAELVPISRVTDPDQAQVQILRRRPARRDGRASHGRAELELLLLERGGPARLEPRVRVSLSPGQRPEALQATALHELGHTFGLWGHSDQSSDAMAAVPTAQPILQLSARDRATFLWLQQQPTLNPGVALPSRR